MRGPGPTTRLMGAAAVRVPGRQRAFVIAPGLQGSHAQASTICPFFFGFWGFFSFTFLLLLFSFVYFILQSLKDEVWTLM